MNVKGHVAASNPRVGIFLVDEIDVQGESDPGCACYACAGLRAVALLVPVRYSSQNSCGERKKKTRILDIVFRTRNATDNELHRRDVTSIHKRKLFF